MSGTENEALVRRYIREVWEDAKPDAARRFLDPSYRRYLSPSAPPLDLEGQIQRLDRFRAAFADIEIVVQDMVAADDRVAFRSILRGTHREEFMGVPPTGRTVKVGLVDVVRIRNGAIVEHWGGPDLFDLLTQIGATVTPQRD